ncbi:ribonuclease H-like domain-containing protein, partial [Tanacetum coccineum]
SDDEEDYGIQRNNFGAPMSGPKPAKYLNYWSVLNTLGCSNAIEDMLEVRVNEMGSNEVLFTSEAWKHAFDIEPIYTKLCHEFYATFEFDEAVADDELMTRKAIKFRLCGKAYAMSILDFSKRLGLYNGAKIQEYRFETYFIGGLRNDDDFSADQYWLNISSEETLTLSRSSAKTIRKPVLRVLQKMITYVMTSNNVYFIASFIPLIMETLDANILRKLIGSNRRLIPEEIAPSIPRVATPKAPRPATSDLYDKISQLETQIGEIERMTRRQSYHSDRYARVLEHIASHYGFTLRDPYNPPNYFEQQQQHDDQE